MTATVRGRSGATSKGCQPEAAFSFVDRLRFRINLVTRINRFLTAFPHAAADPRERARDGQSDIYALDEFSERLALLDPRYLDLLNAQKRAGHLDRGCH